MKAQDVMSSDVVTVRPDLPAREIVRLMRERHVEAVPVVEADGRLVGMIGQDELIGRKRDGWQLALLSEDEAEAADILEKLSRLRDEAHSAADIMSPTADSIRAEADIAEVAGVLEERGLEQVPVVRDGQVLGIVSRTDLLHALAATRPARDETAEPGLFGRVFSSLDEHFQHYNRPETPPSNEEPETRPEENATAKGFQHLVRDFKQQLTEQRRERQQQTEQQRQQKSAELSDKQLSDEEWQDKLRRARDAAENGRTEFLLLRFPNQLCSDGGRAVNAAEPSWPETLRGEAAETYRRFEAELKPQGFALGARIVEYMEGMPGDIGLFLTWGDAAA
jgi:CBS domain-containing protein